MDKPLVHLFDEPQFNTQDGYIGFMCLHPTATYHLEILNEIAERFLFIAAGSVTQVPNFQALISDPRMKAYLGPQLTSEAEALA